MAPYLSEVRRRHPLGPIEVKRKKEKVSSGCVACRLQKLKVILLQASETSIGELTRRQCDRGRPIYRAYTGCNTICRYNQTAVHLVVAPYTAICMPDSVAKRGKEQPIVFAILCI
ncbi:hypothetical protein DM02DRAFT_619522 [Periconia macrospinosa]|uniref:Uncharacterized protein n=1 Tax=Periconia macrospinosa TaxID=97972 RepID=A0A2V1D4X8_9PLEO|nr:hypothetical protein DM02DRAFT_619522 [Periconia macrospinosa]